MSERISIFRDTRHLQILAVLIAAAGAGAFWVRGQLVPPDWGKSGPYRESALAQIASDPHILTADNKCLKCHESVHEERKDSPHVAVRCMHCHGNGHEHMKVAEKGDYKKPETPAAWDNKFPSKVDLFVTKDRAICLSCHMKVLGMPESFKSIDVAKHLEEQGAENVASPEVCFECHTGHSPGIE
ncbi:MAG: hypothetical protein U0996_04240 [Planctomycetaceae bacterium]